MYDARAGAPDRGGTGGEGAVEGLWAGRGDEVVALLQVEPLAGVVPEALDVPELAEAGFQVLGTFAIGIAGVEALPTRVHVARYGDAYALPDTLDRDVALRVISVLQSGRLVETRVIVPAAPPPPSRSAATGSGARPVHRATAALDHLASRAEQAELPWLDRLLATLVRRRLAARYPDRPALGVHRQLLDVDDLDTLWVAHRGLLRRAQGVDDEVADHTRAELFPAALRRAWHVTASVDQPDLIVAQRASRGARNLLLTLPALAGLVQGLAWWASGLVAGVPAIGAVLVRAAIARRSQRPWLIVAPIGVAAVGALTVGWVGILTVFVYDLAVLLLAEIWWPDAFSRWLTLGRGSQPEPRPVPLPELLSRYG